METAYCHGCGGEVSAGDRFCARCGTPLRHGGGEEPRGADKAALWASPVEDRSGSASTPPAGPSPDRERTPLGDTPPRGFPVVEGGDAPPSGNGAPPPV